MCSNHAPKRLGVTSELSDEIVRKPVKVDEDTPLSDLTAGMEVVGHFGPIEIDNHDFVP